MTVQSIPTASTQNSMKDRDVTKILILAANPQHSTPLRLDQEVREIEEGLKRSKYREQFELKQQWAVRPQDLQRAMVDWNPQIVHFSGHGTGDAGLVLETDGGKSRGLERKFTAVNESGLAVVDDNGQMQLVSADALAGLFELFADRVECVLLNACYSEVQATAIVRYIPYAIGMNKAVGDIAARVFAVAFYDALGAGRDIEFAYKSGCVAIKMAGIPESLTPVLKKKSDLPTQQPAAPISLESPEGQVSIDSRFYLTSAYESRCEAEINKPGALIRIKSPDRMGKSSLMAKVLDYGNKQGARAVTIDLSQTNQKFFEDLDKFMQWFCASVGKPLGIRVKMDEYWDDIFGANDNSTDYFENYLLTEQEPPLILAIDNFDRVFQYPDIETDLCGLLRGWHERSKTKKQWENLRLIVVHSQESYAQKDINQSPFNVGLPIELGEFSPAQIRELVCRHGLNWQDRDIDLLIGLIGGHPYLVRVALYYIASGDFSLAEFIKIAPTEAGVYSPLLRGYLKTLEDCPELAAAMTKVVAVDVPVNLRTEAAFKLDSMGLLIRVENNVMPRCDLYRQYFRQRLVT